MQSIKVSYLHYSLNISCELQAVLSCLIAVALAVPDQSSHQVIKQGYAPSVILIINIIIIIIIVIIIIILAFR